MATQAEEDLSGVAVEQADMVRVRLLRNMSPHTLSSLLAVERDAFPECERLGNYMQELSMQRNNGLVIAEDHRPPPGTPPGAFPAPLAEPQGFLLFSRTAEAGVIMKIAVAAAFRGRGVGTALLRCGIAELRRPLRRASPPTIMLHCDPTRISARRMYESSGFVEAQRLTAYYGDGRDALLMKLSNEGRDAFDADVEAQPPGGRA